MFDWNEEELTNIIWGEAGESDDHIVPYHDQIEEKTPVLFRDPSKKEETSNISPLEQKKRTVKSEYATELYSNCKHDGIGEPAVGIGLSSSPSGPDPFSSNAKRADQVSTSGPASDDINKSSKNGSFEDEMAQFDKDSGIFENRTEVGEQGDFVDYGWANIGSFDDLDRIFSNDDPIFGDLSVGNADELWPSPKDVIGSPLICTPLSDSSDSPLGELRNSVQHSEIKAQYMLDPGQPFICGYEEPNKLTSRASQDVQASIDNTENCGSKSDLLLKEKNFVMGEPIQTRCKQLNDGTDATLNELPDRGNMQIFLPNGQKSSKMGVIRQLHDLSGTWTSQANSSYGPPVVNLSPSLVLTQQIPLQKPGTFQPNQFSCAPLSSPLHGNMMNPPYPPSANSEDAGVRPPSMTPEEKIEKLRRRQQMRAILAIQKQQLQFGKVGGKVEVDESLVSFPLLEPNLHVERYDSSKISTVFDNCSVEESVLYRLQDTIAKMDMRIRLCMRDSLFRLAQSSTWRQYLNETSSSGTSGRDEFRSNKDIVSHERFTRMSDVETDTNPIDRTVAHLLFHRPHLDFSGKPAEAPESPLSANLPYTSKAKQSKSLAKGYFPESSENTQMMPPSESKSPAIFTSENASNNENTDQV